MISTLVAKNLLRSTSLAAPLRMAAQNRLMYLNLRYFAVRYSHLLKLTVLKIANTLKIMNGLNTTRILK